MFYITIKPSKNSQDNTFVLLNTTTNTEETHETYTVKVVDGFVSDEKQGLCEVTLRQYLKEIQTRVKTQLVFTTSPTLENTQTNQHEYYVENKILNYPRYTYVNENSLNYLLSPDKYDMNGFMLANGLTDWDASCDRYKALQTREQKKAFTLTEGDINTVFPYTIISTIEGFFLKVENDNFFNLTLHRHSGRTKINNINPSVSEIQISQNMDIYPEIWFAVLENTQYTFFVASKRGDIGKVSQVEVILLNKETNEYYSNITNV